MGRYVLGRLLAMLPLLLAVSAVVFVLFAFVPVDPAAVLLGNAATVERRAAVAAELGLDQPLVVRYADWLAGAVQGEFGQSYISRREVLPDIQSRLPVTLSLVAGGLTVALVVGVPVGILAGLRHNSVADRTLTSGASIFQAMPEFWLALLLVLLVAVQFGVLPVGGYVPFANDPVEWARHLILPCLALGLGPASQIARQTRTEMIEQLQTDYVRALTARATPPWRIVWHYALKNALIPVVTLAGLHVAISFGGSFVIERIFSMPGAGSLMIDALNRSDMPVLQASIVIIAAFVIVANLGIDLIYGALNPKVRPA